MPKDMAEQGTAKAQIIFGPTTLDAVGFKDFAARAAGHAGG